MFRLIHAISHSAAERDMSYSSLLANTSRQKKKRPQPMAHRRRSDDILFLTRTIKDNLNDLK